MSLNQFCTFINSLVKFINEGLPILDSQAYQNRIITCFKCDKRTKDWKCGECGCYIEQKARWASESCPLQKWDLVMASEEKCGCSKS